MEQLSELFEQARAAQAQDPPRKPVSDRHPVRDFFVADIFDCALKDDRASMEHPFFSLSKTPDHRVRHYERNGVQITGKPGADGMATIWDKDVLIFCISQLTEAINQGRPVTRTVRLRAYNYLDGLRQEYEAHRGLFAGPFEVSERYQSTAGPRALGGGAK